jgi:hypothetical protein
MIKMKGFVWIGMAILLLNCNNTISNTEAEQSNIHQEESTSNGELNNNKNPEDVFIVKKKLPKELKENSGIVADGGAIWAITDEKVPYMYKLDQQGNLIQTVEISGVKMKDVEAITADADFLYVGDIGDNDGDRENRIIYKIRKSDIGSGKNVKVKAEEIEFKFKGFEEAKKKKHNEYDAEAIISMGDQLYIFTKRRTDDKTELVSIPKTAGKHVAKSITTFNSKGMITGAGINSSGSEIVLIGYESGHYNSFMILLSNFNAPNVFNGNQQRIGLTSTKIDWQTEGITFGNNDVIYFSCETTSDVPATLYGVHKSNLERVKEEKIK